MHLSKYCMLLHVCMLKNFSWSIMIKIKKSTLCNVCAFDYQLYSDTRRIREKMPLVYLLTVEKLCVLFFSLRYCVHSYNMNERKRVERISFVCLFVWNDSCRSWSWVWELNWKFCAVSLFLSFHLDFQWFRLVLTWRFSDLFYSLSHSSVYTHFSLSITECMYIGKWDDVFHVLMCACVSQCAWLWVYLCV